MYNALAFVAHSCISVEDNAYEYIAVLAYVPQDAGRRLVALRLVWGEEDGAGVHCKRGFSNATCRKSLAK